MIHAIITIFAGIPVLLQLAPPDYLLVIAGFYLGREHAQAEYRYIEQFCDHKRANMPWWGGLSPKVWNAKSLTDWLLPAIVTALYFLLDKRF